MGKHSLNFHACYVCACYVYACVGHGMTSGAEGSLIGLELATRLVGQPVSATLSLSASQVLGGHLHTAVMAPCQFWGQNSGPYTNPTDLPITYFLSLLTIG